ncbi:CDP-glycerol glycerophosphotransferase family protein [Propionispira raffinosivorans]|uniref:CDP-glycerol glycerophosphotransferase family protein n=1 Tax=Propionispira raffinosivorans TaxID=86959 RepID=UPI00037DFBFB|nr:CDP-glycerol glycerophosphotransferase family protein [Propionispira raffinosivorans]
MRKIVQKQIMDMIPAIWGGVQYIQTAESSRVLQVLDDCLLAMETLQESFRSGLSPQRFLYYKQYYDQVVLAMKQLKDIGDIENEILGIYNGLDKMLTDVTNEAEVKVEILFLPYKASMWDSLESIWLTAKDDAKCDAYVMPIPYCDRNPDGSPATWHCEADLFPEYVLVIDFNQYDIAKRKPDAIYIHNPYDEYNRVTSVDPKYYSSELKKHTDMLVYVPYFVLSKRWPEGQTQLACYFNMDKMIVQKDQMQVAPMGGSQLMEQDIKYLSDYIPKEKLVPLGSPKADKVFFCEKHKRIPKEWQNVIKGKKIILYNVSISGLLQFGERALHKLKYIFDCFARREDIVLLFRPHPLLESTMKSMRMDLYKSYKDLEQEFLAKRIGILDKTPDINMAVAIADAYLGESSSSVINLFGVAGKPIFFTDDMMLWNEPTLEEKASIAFHYMHIERDEVWFVAEGYNALCRMNIYSGEIKPLLQFETFPVNGGLYTHFVKIEDKIYFSPMNAKSIYEYDVSSGISKTTALKKALEWGNFGRSISYKKHLFMIPCRYPAILSYDINTGECIYYTKCIKELLPYQHAQHEELLGWECIIENRLLLPALQVNKIIEFDMETRDYHIYDLPGENVDCWRIIEAEVDLDTYWLIPWKTKCIRKWNRKTNTCEFYDIYPTEYSCMQNWDNGQMYQFSGATKVNGAIWLFPRYGNMVLRFDTKSGKIEKVDIGLSYSISDRKTNFYMQQDNFFNAVTYGDNKILALSAYDRSLVIFDTITRTCRLQPCRLSAEKMEMLSTPMTKSFGAIGQDVPYATNENHLWRNVTSFIEYVLHEDHDKIKQKAAFAENIVNADGNCGKKVHQYIMEQI